MANGEKKIYCLWDNEQRKVYLKKNTWAGLLTSKKVKKMKRSGCKSFTLDQIVEATSLATKMRVKFAA